MIPLSPQAESPPKGCADPPSRTDETHRCECQAPSAKSCQSSRPFTVEHVQTVLATIEQTDGMSTAADLAEQVPQTVSRTHQLLVELQERDLLRVSLADGYTISAARSNELIARVVSSPQSPQAAD